MLFYVQINSHNGMFLKYWESLVLDFWKEKTAVGIHSLIFMYVFFMSARDRQSETICGIYCEQYDNKIY